jgi:hypothetical protein
VFLIEPCQYLSTLSYECRFGGTLNNLGSLSCSLVEILYVEVFADCINIHSTPNIYCEHSYASSGGAYACVSFSIPEQFLPSVCINKVDLCCNVVVVVVDYLSIYASSYICSDF